jgi:hypothetical protein
MALAALRSMSLVRGRAAAAITSTLIVSGLLFGSGAWADAPRVRRLLLLDIDGTQIRNQRGVHERKAADRLIDRLAGRHGRFKTAYVTGRSFPIAEQRLGEALFPLNNYDFKVTRGGVEVRQASGTMVPGWLRRLRSSGWDATLLDQHTAQLVDRFDPTVVQQTMGIHGRYRRGVIVHPSVAIESFITEEIVAPLARQMTVLHADASGQYQPRGAGHAPRVATVVSRSTSVPGSVYVDFVPVVAGKPVDKLAAMRWVVDRLELRPDQAIFAGDGTNDPLLRAAEAGFKVIAVGNTIAALKRQLRRQRVDNLFIAQQTHAAGVLEGLAHFAGKGW